jgi:hypothetical protein
MAEYYNTYNDSYIALCKRSDFCPCFKIELLDFGEMVIDELIGDIDTDSGSVSIAYNQGVRRNCTLSITNPNGKYTVDENSPFWFHRKFKLYSGLYDTHTGDTYWFSEGIYFTTKITSDHTKLNITGVDKFAMFTDDFGASTLEVDYVIYTGSLVYDVIKSILLLDNGRGMPYDSKTPIMDIGDRGEMSHLSIPYDITVQEGGYLGDILIELATILGADIYYNTEGHLCVEKGTMDYTYSQKAPQWEYSDDNVSYISSQCDYDMTNVKNCITVTNDTTDGELYSYKAVNDNPKSPTRVSLVGYRCAETIRTNAVNSTDSCKGYAEWILNRDTMIGLSVAIDSVLLPHLDVNKCVFINDSTLKFDIERFIISEISKPLGYGTMSVKAANITQLPYYAKVGA